MRTVQLHPFSVLTGGVLAMLAFVTMGQQSMPPGLIHAVPAPQCQEFLVEYGPHPRDHVQIREGTPYVVPVGKLLTITGLGGSEKVSGNAFLLVDGQKELHVDTSSLNPSVIAVPRGFSVASGSTVEVTFWSGLGRAWGYLVDA